MRRLALLAAAIPVAGVLSGTTSVSVASTAPLTGSASVSPIKHVVIIYQENHSFDNVLGRLCATEARTSPCDGATTGQVEDGSSVPLQTSSDIVPLAGHDTASQLAAIDAGKMDAFDKVVNCAFDQFAPPPGATRPYSNCYTQYDPSQIPSLATLARQYAISDRTFETAQVPSFGAHMELAAATLDGFTGDNPKVDRSVTTYPGWGCDSNMRALWSPDGGVTPYIYQPSCVPFRRLDRTRFPYGGAYKPTKVPWVPTIMDRAQAAGVSLRIYAAHPPITTPAPQSGTATAVTTRAPFSASGTSQSTAGYVFSFCAYFAECLYTNQRAAVLAPPEQFDTDARNGTLPAISFVVPGGSKISTNQHNTRSMLVGDNRIAQIVNEIQGNPVEWGSTAIFITYDDCGCFYDHVPPPSPELGIRVPMVIVSPYAKPGYTDHSTATYASMLAYIEHNFGLTPLNATDGNAYDYGASFDYSQVPLAPTRLTQHEIPVSSEEYLRAHVGEDDDDPT